MDPAATGSFIAKLRKEKGYTQKQLAEKLMVTDKAVSRWETGKGLPETSLLGPLGKILDVSVGELLAGERIPETEVKEQTDRILLEALRYSGRTLSGAGNLLLLLAGLALLMLPLFLAVEKGEWALGLVPLALAALRIGIGRRGTLVKQVDRSRYLFAVVLQGGALLAELLPASVILVRATSPTDRILEPHSFFSLTAAGNALFTPLLAGVLTIVSLLLGVYALVRFSTSAGCRKAVFVCTLLALVLSLVPLLLFGTLALTAASAAVPVFLLCSVCLQAAANRKTL